MVVIEMEKVQILLSTYNGEKYLSDQIESICKQTFENWELIIRDDGSTDSTVKIIQKFADANKNIIFLNKENIANLGVVNSFFELMRLGSGDLYMFCDQDDIWLPDKIEYSLGLIKTSNSDNVPLAACTDVSETDLELNITRKKLYLNPRTRFKEILVENRAQGSTMIFNDACRKIALQIEPIDIPMHDWWIALVASCFGDLIFGEKVTMLYRQHENNVEGSKKSTKGIISSITKRKKQIFSQAIIFKNTYPDIPAENLTILNQLISLGTEKKDAFKILFGNELSTNNVFKSLLLRISVLFGKDVES
jgi:rhamnosyltransferase